MTYFDGWKQERLKESLVENKRIECKSCIYAIEH